MVFAAALQCPSCGSSKLCIGLSLTRQENEALMIEGSSAQRAANWLDRGEIGSSSLTIHAVLTNTRSKELAHPQDVSDLRRCVYLMDHVPEWQNLIHRMADISPQWARLAGSWEMLISTYRDETANGHREAPAAYELLRSLLADADADASAAPSPDQPKAQ
jgi:hypothetical protein